MLGHIRSRLNLAGFSNFLNSFFSYYFNRNFDWLGNCSNAEEVFNTVVGTPKDFIEWGYFTVENEGWPIPLDLTNNGSFYFKDNSRYGRCFTIKYPENKIINSIDITFNNYTFNIYVHDLGNFFGDDLDNKKIIMNGKYSVSTVITHEIFETLDFNGKSCENYLTQRDECVYAFIDQVTNI